MKSTVFNLIVIDESGSMQPFKPQTISGCNETLNVIRANEKKNADVMRNLVSIYAFQTGGPESRYLIKNTEIDKVKDLTDEDYCPCGCTPLYDAIGATLSELKTIVSTHPEDTAVVTIMTDGYENSSTQYTPSQVAKLIDACREMGWTINVIGANINVDALAKQLHVNEDNALKYQQTAEGSKEMWCSFAAKVGQHLQSEACISRQALDDNWSEEERVTHRKKNSTRFFKR